MGKIKDLQTGEVFDAWDMEWEGPFRLYATIWRDGKWQRAFLQGLDGFGDPKYVPAVPGQDF